LTGGARDQRLQITLPYELAVNGLTSSHLHLGGMHSAYVRGEASSLRRFSIIAQLQLGRAFALSGDQSSAKTACQDFLALWRDADPDIPTLTQGRTEYAGLH